MSNNRFFQPSSIMEEEQDPSLLLAYLKREEVMKQITENAERYLGKNPESDGHLSRIFNDLPGHYEGVQPLVETVEIAVSDKEKMGFWLDLVVITGMKDLFDRQGNIHRDIYAALNHQSDPNQPGLLDKLITTFGETNIKSRLLCAYITGLVCSKTAEMVGKIQHDLVDEETFPNYIYSSALNERLKIIIAHQQEVMQNTISILANDISSRSSVMKEFITEKMGNPIELPYLILSFVGSKLENIKSALTNLVYSNKENTGSYLKK